jgi:hypothetical protein
MQTATTAAGTNSCVNIDVNAFNKYHVYSARKTSDI